MLSKYLFDVFCVFAIMLVVDGIYLSITSGPFVKMIERVQRAKIQLKWVGALISYVIMATLLYIFAIIPKYGHVKTFLLGALSYGIYDSVNYALFTNYDGLLAIQDTIWGGVLFTVVKMTYQFIFQ